MEVVPTPAFDEAYLQECEDAFNQQIERNLSASYALLSMSSYFKREDVGLLNFAGYFFHLSVSELGYAENLMTVQVQRGRQIQFSNNLNFEEQDWDDPLYALEYICQVKQQSFADFMSLYLAATEQGDQALSYLVNIHLLQHLIRDIMLLRYHLTRLFFWQSEDIPLAEYNFSFLDENVNDQE
ncbi:ferritin heavy chain-like [Echinops telfairi]|uniref:Ferritin n=1 Tax=Echinops telfairi TaxID=9371 RepID=A0ABM0ZTW4_ECHTE|nr:ferritin heavy chain-like [Echinops telfairi]